jgi:hypothetical protein
LITRRADLNAAGPFRVFLKREKARFFRRALSFRINEMMKTDRTKIMIKTKMLFRSHLTTLILLGPNTGIVTNANVAALFQIALLVRTRISRLVLRQFGDIRR